MRILRLMLMVTLGGFMTGCGQKGPLVLPDAQRPHKQIGIPRTPAAKPAPSAPAPTPAPAGPGAPAEPLPAPATPNGSQTNSAAAPQS